MSEQSSSMNHLEQEGERKVAQLMKTDNVSEKTLMDIIKQGNHEFHNEHGRNMTYAEMRSIYG